MNFLKQFQVVMLVGYFFVAICPLALGFSFHTALQHIKAERFEEALKELESLAAEVGSASHSDHPDKHKLMYIYHTIGIILFEGKTGDPKYNDAAKWFQKSAQLNFAPAHLNLGFMYARGLGIPLKYHHAEYFFKRALELEHPAAAINLAWTAIAKTPGPAGTFAALDYLKQITEQRWDSNWVKSEDFQKLQQQARIMIQQIEENSEIELAEELLLFQSLKLRFTQSEEDTSLQIEPSSELRTISPEISGDIVTSPSSNINDSPDRETEITPNNTRNSKDPISDNRWPSEIKNALLTLSRIEIAQELQIDQPLTAQYQGESALGRAGVYIQIGQYDGPDTVSKAAESLWSLYPKILTSYEPTIIFHESFMHLHIGPFIDKSSAYKFCQLLFTNDPQRCILVELSKPSVFRDLF